MKALEATEIYLKATDVLDFTVPQIAAEASEIKERCADDISLAKALYEFVRDEIDHSFDINAQRVTCAASEVLKEGHGICYAKSHLLAALSRACGILAGLCYQKLLFEDGSDKMCIHGLNAMYLESLGKWIRLDARGNKDGVDAQFNLHEEQLAFPVRKELGEVDYDFVYAEPPSCIKDSLTENKTCVDLMRNLPADIR